MGKRILSKSSIRDFEVQGFELESPVTVTVGRFLGILFLIYKMGGINRIIWGLSEIKWLKPAAQALGVGCTLGKEQLRCRCSSGLGTWWALRTGTPSFLL